MDSTTSGRPNRLRVPSPARPRIARFFDSGTGVRMVVIGLLILWIVLTVANPRFLSPGNLTNLTLQVAGVAVVSFAATIVLLIGEIDLSIGAVSGLAAGVMGILSVTLGMGAPIAIAIGLLTGTAVGLLQGFVITRSGVPSFVATLGGLLAWQGALLYVLGPWGTLNITDPSITRIASTFLPGELSVVIAVVVLVAYAADRLAQRRRRSGLGLAVGSSTGEVSRIALLGVGMAAALLVFQSSRGVPLVLLIVLGLAVALNWVLSRTLLGRRIYAVGGNREAAERAGIGVNRVRLIVFATASTLAACGGILAASRLLAVNQNSGSGDLLLLSIAGPVIGGVSLFGGVGTIWMALLGIVIIGSIANGMDLLQIESSVRYMLTGAILVVAVVVDATSRKRRKAAGRG